MRCERAQELFSEYCEGALQPALTVPLESHLTSCAECRATVQDLKEVWRILDSPMAAVEPPAGFRAAVWSRIDAEEEKSRRSWRPRFAFQWRLLFTRPALGRAAAVLLVVVLSGVYIPMRFTAARMTFPWSLFYSTPAPITLTVQAWNPRIETREGSRYLVVPLRAYSSQPVYWIATPVSNASGLAVSAPFKIRNGASTEVWLELRGAQAGQKVTILVAGYETSSPGREFTITIPEH
jgi:anti-sigma-K factor RskA